MPQAFLLGATVPLTRVSAPQSKEELEFRRRRLLVAIYRMFSVEGAKVRIADLVSRFPYLAENIIRRTLRVTPPPPLCFDSQGLL
jgi:hypothetical protein